MSFRSARALLQLVVHSLEAAALERRAAAALASSRRVARLHDREERRLRDALRRAVPLIRREPARLTQEGACPRGVAGRLQERLLRDFVHPLTLAQLADDMHMNPSYLSTVFAREVGMPFKAYLTTLRMQHAQELLGNAACRIRDVAAAVGYSSPDRFRAAFRAWTSLAPSGWRRLMRVREADRPLEPGAALPARSRRAGSIVPCTALPAGV